MGKYKQTYRKIWESDPDLQEWIAPCPGDDTRAICRYCKATLSSHYKDLVIHATTKKHQTAFSSVEPLSSPAELPRITFHLNADVKDVKRIKKPAQRTKKIPKAVSSQGSNSTGELKLQLMAVIMQGVKKDMLGFGVFRDPDSGEEVQVDRYTLTSASGVEVQVISYGACVSAILVPDKSGKKEHVTLGFDDLQGYLEYSYQGSTVGRRANRIGKGKLVVEGQQYNLSINNNDNHLHGGKRGWDKYVWESHVDNNSVVFSRLSPDGEEGYPGAVLAQVRYALDAEGGLKIDFEAMTTKATPINMTNHCFFNLAGHDAGQKGLLEHVVRVNADRYTPVDQTLIPTGELAPVRGTAFDLRSPTTYEEALPKAPDGGFDHNFCLQFKHRGQLELAASFLHLPTGRGLEVYTSEPGVQIYTGNFLPKVDQVPEMVGRNGSTYTYQGAFCCEPQNFPDAVNQTNFPNDIYYPGKPYKHSMVYKFFVQK